MAGIRLQQEESADLTQIRAAGAGGDLVSDDERSVAVDTWSIKSDYGSTVDGDQRHADAAEALSAAVNCRAASDYSSDKEELDAEGGASMLGLQSYWDAAYADELANFHEHGHAGEVWQKRRKNLTSTDTVQSIIYTERASHKYVLHDKGLGLMSWMSLLLGQKAYALNFLKVAFLIMLMISSLKLLKRVINICPAGVYLTLGLAMLYSFTNLLSRVPSPEMVKVANARGPWYSYMDPQVKNKFSDLTGVDYSEGAINLARRLADRDGFSNIKLLVDDVLETKLERQFQLVMDKGTLDAIGLHPDGAIKRIIYWESVSKLLAFGGILVITSCNNTKDDLVQEVENFKQRRIDASLKSESMKGHEASRDPPFRYLNNVRTYPTFKFGGSVGSRVATVAFLRN